MPCYTVQTMSVELHAENSALLDKAIAALGWTVTKNGSIWTVRDEDYNRIELDLTAGTATTQTQYQDRVNALKRAYSQQALTLAARQKGWIVRTKTQTTGQIIKY